MLMTAEGYALISNWCQIVNGPYYVFIFYTAGNIQDLPTNNPTTDAAPQLQGTYLYEYLFIIRHFIIILSAVHHRITISCIFLLMQVLDSAHC